jgi:hypothetical protein
MVGGRMEILKNSYFVIYIGLLLFSLGIAMLSNIAGFLISFGIGVMVISIIKTVVTGYKNRF